jgi:hypothetical protein
MPYGVKNVLQTRPCLAIEEGQSRTREDVARVLSQTCNYRNEHLIQIQADNGPGFISLSLDIAPRKRCLQPNFMKLNPSGFPRCTISNPWHVVTCLFGFG